MPIILIIVASLMLVVGFRGTGSHLGTLLKGDFTGKGNFGLWVLAFVIIGSVGYIPQAKKLSDTFLLIVMVGIVFANDRGTTGGFFTKFQQAVQTA
jgi:hypothetical protein